MHRRTALLLSLVLPLAASPLGAAPAPLQNFVFPSIDGGELRLSDWSGRAILVVNTASQCGFTNQYDGLQKLADRYADRGLVVLTVPSDDFNQELESAAEVKEFCDVNFGLDLPMTDITKVRGRNAHSFYAWLRDTEGFQPRWNFNKVLIAADGSVAETFGASTRPLSNVMTSAVEDALSE